MSINKNQEVVLDRSKIKGSVFFDTLDTHRLVPPEQTAAVIILLRNYFKENKNKSFDLDMLIPENIGIISDELKYSQYLVNKNYLLLKPNKLLSYDEALFLLLGLNTEALHGELPDEFTLFKNKPSKNSLEYCFYITLQNEELSKSMFLRPDGSITSNDLNIVANNSGFFVKPKSTTVHKDANNRNYPEWLSKGLYDNLTSQDLIEGDYDQFWTWIPKYNNTLGYLADELSLKFATECPTARKQKNLTAYVQYSGGEFRKMSESKDYATRNKIKIAISELNKLKPKS